MTEEELYPTIKRIIRVEMTKRSIGYAELNDRLRHLGVEENERNLRNKVARGSMSAAYFVILMIAMGVTEVDTSFIQTAYDSKNWDPVTKTYTSPHIAQDKVHFEQTGE